MVIYNRSEATATIHVVTPEVDTNLTISAPLNVVAGENFIIEGVLTRADTSVALSGETIALSYIDVNLNKVSLGTTTTGTIEGAVKYQKTVNILVPNPDDEDYTLMAEFEGSERAGLTLRPTSSIGNINIGANLNVPVILAGVTALSVFLMMFGLYK
ncbi:MAG TPA: hypothetical protein ENI05_05865 [Porticoccus sp.]|nr:hypothetical protein [Porticoccus sp.]